MRRALLNRLVHPLICSVFLAATMAFSCVLRAQEPAATVGSPSLPSRPVHVSVPDSPSPTASVTPAVVVSPPSGAPIRTLPALADNEIIPMIDFPSTDIRQVLEFYETLTGKKALYDNTVQGNIHVRVTKPVARVEAVRILETVFALNNFTLIPGTGNIVKVINTSKNVRQFNIPIFSEIDQIPEGNQVITFLFKLEYADPTEVKTALDQVIAATPSVTNIVPLPKSQAVLVTETSDMIRNIAPVVARLDSKPADVVSEFFPLERADAKEVVEKLTKMFEKNPNASGSAPSGGAPNPNGAPATPGMVTLSEDALIVGKIKIEADLRTNRIHVVTRPVNLPFLRTLISELDSGLPLGEPSTRPLRFVLAGDVLDVVAGAVAEPGVKVEKLENSNAARSGAANPVSNSTSNLGNTSSSGRSSSSGITAGAFNSGHSAIQTDTAPEGRIIRNTKIIADNRINAIIVVGNEEMKAKVFKLLEQIDVRAPQVMLTAVIGELTLEDNEQFGVNYLFHKGNLSNILSSGSSAILTDARALPSNFTGLSAASLPITGGGVTGLIGATKSLDLIVNALESTGRFHITSRPMIFTSNNRAAIISSGQSVPVQSNNINAIAGNTTSYDYIDVALKLSVLPLINSDGEVTLHITQEANDYTPNQNLNIPPTITTRSIDTTVSVANEATIALGGLVTVNKTTSASGIPILRKLPLIGPLFGSKTKDTTRKELIVLIRPTVTNGPVEAIKAGEKAIEKTNFPHDLDASLDPPAPHAQQDTTKSFATPKPFLRPENSPQE